MAAAGLLILRVVIGVIMIGHGAQKAFGWWGGPGIAGWTSAMTRMRIRPPWAWAYVSMLGELGGGILLILGLLTPLACAAIAGSMLVAIYLVHLPRGFWVSKGGYEFNLSILGAVIALALIGPGAASVDVALRINVSQPVVLIVLAIAVIAGVGTALVTRTAAAEVTKPEAAS